MRMSIIIIKLKTLRILLIEMIINKTHFLNQLFFSNHFNCFRIALRTSMKQNIKGDCL